MAGWGDVESLDGIVVALYAAVSFPAGGAPDWPRFRNLFDPAALVVRIDPRLTAIPIARRESPAILATSVEAWIARADALIQAGSLPAFEERELLRRTEVFGDLAHVFSSFERVVGELPPVRGINSMQLVKDGERWWIASLAWTDESAENPLPSHYVPRG